MSRFRKRRILVVDDDERNYGLLKIVLEPMGHEILAAFDGGEALCKVASSPPDVILLDVVMPVMDGMEVLRRLKQDVGTRDIPIIMVSGISDSDVKASAFKAGADDFLTKPFSKAELKARVGSMMKVKHYNDWMRERPEELKAFA